MNLELYKDYGTVCHAICVSLSHKNNSTVSQIHSSIFNSDISLIYQGLALLIQRNIVSYYKLNSKFYYTFTPNRRLYYNLYLSYIRSIYDITNYKHFFTVLLSGSYKLINTELDIYKDDYIITIPVFRSIKRSKSNIYTVNYEKLDKALVDQYTIQLIKNRYTRSVSEVYKAVCKCSDITVQNVLNSLESSNILIKDNISYINDISNIEEYLKYLLNFGVINKDVETGKYVKGNTKELLMKTEICKIFKHEKVIFNLLSNVEHIKDSEIAKNCLFNDYKRRLFTLMKYKSVYTEGGDTWVFNKKWNIGICREIDCEINKRLININKLYEEGSIYDNEEFIVSCCEVNYLSMLNFIFN